MPISKISKQHSADPGFAKSNFFDSDSDSETNTKPARTSSVPVKTNLMSSPGYDSSAAKNRYDNDFHDSGGLENQSVQELENYAVHKSKETTQKVNDCLKIAEVIREDASRTLETLHQQGEQIARTHQTAVNIDQDLSKSETLLSSLGGFFSKPWKPKKTRQIKGPVPVVTRDDSFKRKGNKEQREKLGLSSGPQARPRNYSEPTTAMEKVQVEKQKQDDSLSDLSDVLGQLKDIALDMGTELEGQNKALDGLHDDVEELNHRIKGANQRTRKLLGK
ncbi:SNAP25-like protein SNAP33 [Cocos nucifera]|uniref:SNAP25-like protein SNAP33 n=1 Tax=Cocos nucifera TaxID=13894 RepID=A0A8K0NBK6_COCNU|nr:SNAP25-like protein SNAP33 [Cocos nucifera]